MLEHKIILASGSPRRAEILKILGWPFEAITAGIDEQRHDGENAVAYVTRLAHAKARVVAGRVSSGIVVGADTVVVIDGAILGQPRDQADARRMLGLLNGSWHEVLTGIALVRASENGHSVVEHEKTRVRFGDVTAEEIDWYVSTGEPMDKAGAYAVQGRAALFIEEIQGDYFNVMGLPVRLLFKLIKRITAAD